MVDPAPWARSYTTVHASLIIGRCSRVVYKGSNVSVGIKSQTGMVSDGRHIFRKRLCKVSAPRLNNCSDSRATVIPGKYKYIRKSTWLFLHAAATLGNKKRAQLILISRALIVKRARLIENSL